MTKVFIYTFSGSSDILHRDMLDLNMIASADLLLPFKLMPPAIIIAWVFAKSPPFGIASEIKAKACALPLNAISALLTTGRTGPAQDLLAQKPG